MTVSTELSHEEYTGNGVTTDFDFRFRIFEAKHLVVSIADTNGTERILTNGTDYTLRGVGSYRGGKVILKMPLATGWKIGIARDLPAVQETDLRNQGKFFAEVHEDAFDYLTMLVQKIFGFFSLCLRKPSFISDHYDAKGNKISNLGKPVIDDDAVDLGTMNEHISAKDKRSLRVADKDIPALPGTSVRRNKQLGFDSNGMPLLLDPAETGALGYVLVDSFEKGAVITSRYQALHWLHNGEYYRWDGALPKTVPAGSTPESAGGIGVGVWVGVGDTALRGDLSAPGGVDLVNGAAKQTDLDSLESSVSDLADAVAKGPSGSAFTRRLVYSTDGLNIYYHITKIPKGVGNINKEYANPPTFTGGIMYVVPESPTTVIRRQKHSPMISSSDGFQSANNGAGGFQPWGLQIANGVAYQDFTPVDSSHGRSALIIQRDGSVIPAEYTDGKTAQQYVDEGAWCSFGWHYMLVKNGVAYADVSSQTDISARAVFGVYPDGTYCLIHTQGQSTVFGMTYPQLQALCVAEGLLHAVALDGGGSAQLLKDNVYVHPSTDASPRALGTYACINVPVRSLDTGWLNLPLEASVVTSGTIRVRQIDDKILYKYDFNLTIAAANTVYTPALQASLSRYLYPYLGHAGNTYSTWLTPRSGGQMGTMSVFAQGESSAVVTVQTGTTTSTTFRGCATFESRYCAADFGGLG